MAKLVSRELEQSLLEEQIFERKKKDLESLKKESGEIMLPDFSHTAKQVLEDMQYKGIIARAVGKEFEEREYISVSDLQKLMSLAELDENLRRKVEFKLIPLRKKGKKWEHRESKKLRKQYISKSDQLFEIISKFQFNGISKSEEIFLSGASIFDKTSAYLEFSSAAAVVDKCPRKRKTTKASGSILFREIYVDGERGAVFALFDGFDERGFEYLPSSIAANILREKLSAVPKKQDILPFLENFAKEADSEISRSVKGFCGTSATCGIIMGTTLFYINMGNNRVYGITPTGEMKRIVGDELFFTDKLEKLYAELKYPYLYLGGFTQRMKGKRSFKVVQTSFTLRAPHIGSVDISQYSNLLIASSGAWKSTLNLAAGQVISDESKFSDVLIRARNALNAVERINVHVKSSMKEAKNHSVIDDVAVLYFSI
ncbi:hypothetical protein KJ780_05225 [Candidatus Micrarchaeota archaeon]|nr:hypothetical protein [Candidatus Micrarchaeota archaeon]